MAQTTAGYISGVMHEARLEAMEKEAACSWREDVDCVPEYSAAYLLLRSDGVIDFGSQSERGHWYRPNGRELPWKPVAVAYIRQSAVKYILDRIARLKSRETA